MKCSICLSDDDEYNNTKYITLKCNHKFHKSCIKTWLDYSNNCPLCRTKIFKERICDCPIYCPYVKSGECRFCFGINKKDFVKKYYNILNI